MLRTKSWLIDRVKVIYIDTVFEKHISSENIYFLIFCCQLWSTINLFSNYWTNWTYSRRSFTRNILAAWLSNRQETRRPNTIFSKKRFLKKEDGFHIVYYIRYHTNWWIVLWTNWFISSTRISLKMFIMHAMKKKHYEDWEIREKCKCK